MQLLFHFLLLATKTHKNSNARTARHKTDSINKLHLYTVAQKTNTTESSINRIQV